MWYKLAQQLTRVPEDRWIAGARTALFAFAILALGMSIPNLQADGLINLRPSESANLVGFIVHPSDEAPASAEPIHEFGLFMLALMVGAAPLYFASHWIAKLVVPRFTKSLFGISYGVVLTVVFAAFLTAMTDLVEFNSVYALMVVGTSVLFLNLGNTICQSFVRTRKSEDSEEYTHWWDDGCEHRSACRLTALALDEDEGVKVSPDIGVVNCADCATAYIRINGAAALVANSYIRL